MRVMYFLGKWIDDRVDVEEKTATTVGTLYTPATGLHNSHLTVITIVAVYMKLL